MDLLWYLSAFRRRWPVIASTLVVAILAAWLTTETIAPLTETTTPTYTASTLLASDGSPIADLPGTTKALSTYATIAQVASRAAKDLGYKGNPLKLAERIEAAPDLETPFVTVTSSGLDPQRAEKIANAFSNALIDFLHDHKTRFYKRLIVATDRTILEAIQQGSDERTILSYRSQRAILQSQLASPVGVTVIQKAVAKLVEPTGGFSPPDSGLVRLAIAAVIGLLAGAGLVLVLERVDTKIRTAEQATDRFGYPVLAEIPAIPREHRKGVVTADHPTSPSADAFRLLAAGANVAARPALDQDAGDGRMILVTSSGPAEGKSTVVANLASALAEEGGKVIVFSADLRRPTLHEVLGADQRPGLVQAARDGDSGLGRFAQRTRFHRVSFVPSGGSSERPGEVLGSPKMAALLEEARATADWIVLDTAPILLAGESAPLIDQADLVLVVARSGVTSTPVAERTRETMHRLGADAAWVVLNASPEGVPSAYKRYHVSDAEEPATLPKGFPR